MNWYDLPKYYDLSFSHDMRAELQFLKQIFSSKAAVHKRLLEPACGTGRLIVPMVKAGFTCTGFDTNPAVLDYLKKNCSVMH
jgi:2-polyprenyl-3-methyl-5-hydroxy-6-metoxy-1,4-benzoquinol methylase